MAFVFDRWNFFKNLKLFSLTFATNYCWSCLTTRIKETKLVRIWQGSNLDRFEACSSSRRQIPLSALRLLVHHQSILQINKMCWLKNFRVLGNLHFQKPNASKSTKNWPSSFTWMAKRKEEAQTYCTVLHSEQVKRK